MSAFFRPLRRAGLLFGLSVLLVPAVVGLPACTQPPPQAPLGEQDQRAGEDAMRAGQYAVADDLFQRAFVRGGDAPTAMLWQSRAQLALGAPGEARARLARLMDLAPQHLEGALLQVRVDLLLGEYEDAQKHLDALAKGSPTEPQIPLLRAELYLAIGLYDRAARELESARAAQAAAPELPFLSAALALGRGELARVRGLASAAAQAQGTGLGFAREAYLADRMGERDRAERAYLDAAVHAQAEPQIHSLASDFYAAQGRMTEGLAELGRLERLLGHTSPDLTRRIAALLVRGGHQAEAQALLKPYLQRHVGDRLAARELALSYLLDGKDTEAMATLEVLATQERDSAPIQYLAGLARLRMGDASRARGALNEAARLGTDGYPTELALAAAALIQGDAFDAEFQARKRLDLAPDDWLAGVVWAAARKLQGQLPAAAALVERLCARFPQQAADIRALVPLPDGTAADAGALPQEVLARVFPPPAPPAPTAAVSAPRP